MTNYLYFLYHLSDFEDALGTACFAVCLMIVVFGQLPIFAFYFVICGLILKYHSLILLREYVTKKDELKKEKIND